MYAVTFKESARKELYALPSKMLRRVAQLIDGLSQNPRPPGVKTERTNAASLAHSNGRL